MSIFSKFAMQRRLEFQVERIFAAHSKDDQTELLRELILLAQECITDVHMQDEPNRIYKTIEDIDYSIPDNFKKIIESKQDDEGFDFEKHLQEVPAYIRKIG